MGGEDSGPSCLGYSTPGTGGKGKNLLGRGKKTSRCFGKRTKEYLRRLHPLVHNPRDRKKNNLFVDLGKNTLHLGGGSFSTRGGRGGGGGGVLRVLQGRFLLRGDCAHSNSGETLLFLVIQSNQERKRRDALAGCRSPPEKKKKLSS